MIQWEFKFIKYESKLWVKILNLSNSFPYHFRASFLDGVFGDFLTIFVPWKPQKSCSRRGGSSIFTKFMFWDLLPHLVQKWSAFRCQNRPEIEENSKKNLSQNKFRFDIIFFRFGVPIRPPNWDPKKWVFSLFFWSWAQEAPERLQEASKRLQ